MKNDVLAKLIAWGIEVQYQSLPARTDEIVPGCVFSLMPGIDEGCFLVLQATRRDGPVGLPTEEEAVQGVLYSFSEELKGFEGVSGYMTNANFANTPKGETPSEAGYVRYSLFTTVHTDHIA